MPNEFCCLHGMSCSPETLKEANRLSRDRGQRLMYHN